MIEYKKAQNALRNREVQIQKAVGMLENNMLFLGVSGVEDKL